MSTAPIAATSAPAGSAMSLLSNGVPLSLLLDLVFGPHSEELLFAERAGGFWTPPEPAA